MTTEHDAIADNADEKGLDLAASYTTPGAPGVLVFRQADWELFLPLSRPLMERYAAEGTSDGEVERAIALILDEITPRIREQLASVSLGLLERDAECALVRLCCTAIGQKSWSAQQNEAAGWPPCDCSDSDGAPEVSAVPAVATPDA